MFTNLAIVLGASHSLFPTCQVRVVRFYVSCLLLLLSSSRPLLLSSSSPPPLLLLLLVVLLLVVLLVLLVQLRPAIHSVLCRTSTTTIHVSVPCRTSTMTIHAQLRSGREHWAWMVVVEVRQGTLGGDTRG